MLTGNKLAMLDSRNTVENGAKREGRVPKDPPHYLCADLA